MHPTPPAVALPDEAAGDVDSVLSALMTVGRAMRQRVAGDDLEPGVLFLLKNIDSRGPLRVSELAGCTHLDPSTVSRHVSQLDRTGLLERTPDPDDRRAHRLQLTEVGRHRLRLAFERRRALLSQVLARWDADDVAALDRLLNRFVDDIDTSAADLEHP